MLLPFFLLSLKTPCSILTFLLVRSSTHSNAVCTSPGEESRQPGLSAAGCCRGKSLAAKPQPSLTSLAGDHAPTFPHPEQNFQPRAILGGTHQRCGTFIAIKTPKGKKKIKKEGRTSIEELFFKSQGLFVAFWHTAHWNCAYQMLQGFSNGAMAFQHVLCSCPFT